MKRNRVLIAAEDYQFLDTVHGAAMIVQEWQVANSLERIAELVASQPLAVVIDLEAPCFDATEVLKLLASLRVESRIVLLAGDDLRKLTSAKRAAATEGLQIAGTLTRPLTMIALSRLLEQHAEKSNPISVEELATGIAGHELVLHYQPILSRVADRYVIRAAEALVRWQHPARGLLYPGQFLKVAETGGLLGDLTDFVLGEATRQAGSWESRRMDVGISINMSPGLVNDSGFVERFMRVLREHDVSPQRVTLELTEAASPRDREMLRDVLTRLRLHGVSLSLDDFGTGYSSLTELCRLPFNEIKIDRTLVHDVPDLREASTVVQAIVELAHRLSIRVCAEGVETVAAREFLTRAGCDSMQGVLFARPMPAADLEVLLARADGDQLDIAEAANA